MEFFEKIVSYFCEKVHLSVMGFRIWICLLNRRKEIISLTFFEMLGGGIATSQNLKEIMKMYFAEYIHINKIKMFFSFFSRLEPDVKRNNNMRDDEIHTCYLTFNCLST